MRTVTDNKDVTNNKDVFATPGLLCSVIIPWLRPGLIATSKAFVIGHEVAPAAQKPPHDCMGVSVRGPDPHWLGP